MRRVSYLVLTLLAIWPLLGSAAAQTTAHNTVVVRIPIILGLRVDAASARDARAVDFTIRGREVAPAQATIDVLANTSWALTVQDAGGDGPELEYDVDGAGAWSTPEQRHLIMAGDATDGWLTLRLRFRAEDTAAALSEATTARTLLFTLTRP